MMPNHDGSLNDAELDRLRAKLNDPDPKPLTFTLSITLGNEAMQFDGDVGRALIALGEELASSEHPEFEMTTIDPVSIRDTNGNTVGEWRVQ